MNYLIPNPKAGDFAAVCDLDVEVEYSDLTIEQRDLVEERKIGARLVRKGMNGKAQVVSVPCNRLRLDTRGAFEHHMREVHDGGRYRWDNGSIDPKVREVRHYKPRTPIPAPMWRSPKLTEEGKPFEPTDLEVGARIEWDGRTGQVWSLGHVPKSVWVVPDEPSTQRKDGAGTRHELAALVVLSFTGRLHEHENAWSSWKTEAA